MPNPSISVIIPTYQRAHVVGEAIASVLGQTHRDFELLVVDDGSTDATAEAISQFTDERLRFVPIDHGGRSRARNEGAKRARGQALVFLDSDDRAESQWLSELVRALDGPAPIVCCGARYTMFAEPAAGDRTLMPTRLGALYANRVGLFLAGTFAVRRALFEEVGGYDERLAYAENTELGIRLAMHCEQHALPFAIVQQPVVWIRRWRGFGGDTDDFRTCLEATELILQRHGNASGQFKPSSWANYRAIAGVNASRLGLSGRAICHLAAAAASKPASPLHWARLGLSLVPPIARRFWTRRAKQFAPGQALP
jgi:glycosyltransferase involved in cell wall biosynthesis